MSAKLRKLTPREASDAGFEVPRSTDQNEPVCPDRPGRGPHQYTKLDTDTAPWCAYCGQVMP